MAVSVCAVIVTYNRLEKLQKTLDVTLRQAFTAVVVVDNASTDGTGEWLDSVEDGRLTVMSLPENIGGAGGFHEGVKAALGLPVDWLVLYDDDAYPAADALDKLASLPKDCDAAAAAVYYPDGRICEMNRPSWNPFWHKGFFYKTVTGLFSGKARNGFHLPLSAYQDDDFRQVDASSFVGLFIRRQPAEKIALPRKDLFIYADDMLYTLNLTAQGGRILFAPQFKFIHDCETLKTDSKVYSPMWKAYFTYRNGLILYRMAAGRWFFCVFLLKAVSWLLAVRFYRNKWLFLQLWRLAVWDGLWQKTDRPAAFIMQKFRERQ